MVSVPAVWLGQSVDTSSICSKYPELNQVPFLTSLGCAIRKPSLKESHFHSNLRSKLGIKGPLMVDSGGFALMMNPHSRWNVGDVSALIQRIDAEIFVSLDHPPGRQDTKELRRNKIARSSRNFRTLSDRFPSKIVMPVVHGRTTEEIELSLKLIKRHRQTLPWIGLGGIVPLLQNRTVSREISRQSPEFFIAQSILKVRQSFPKSKIHAFGAGGTRTFPAIFAFGADSADSIGWRQAAGFGSIFLPFKSQRAVGSEKGTSAPRKTLDQSDLIQLEGCRCPICISQGPMDQRLNSFRRSFHALSIHNAWTLANQFQYWPPDRRAMMSLVASGVLGRSWARAAELVFAKNLEVERAA
jgi:queuine/archaeosine tRNA-ribosyltransferase